MRLQVILNIKVTNRFSARETHIAGFCTSLWIPAEPGIPGGRPRNLNGQGTLPE